MTSFALIGAAGYVAPRHMRAIRDVGGDLKVALDPNDSVGVIDSHFPDARFFVEFERFDRHIDKLRRANEPIDYVSICSPNYLHDAHVRFALRADANAICEKPLVLNPWNLDGLAETAQRTNRNVNTILQLRLHPAIKELRERVAADPKTVHEVDVTYITSRGRWYQVSWKGDNSKSGGIATNIGIHLFDMLGYVFGPARSNVVHLRTPYRAAGYLELAKARVRWFLSIARDDIPAEHATEKRPGARSRSTARSLNFPKASQISTRKATGKSSPAAVSALRRCGRPSRSPLPCARRRSNGRRASAIPSPASI